MNQFHMAAEQISLFCRLNINTKKDLPIRSSEMGVLIYLCKADGDKTPMGVAGFFKFSKAMATNTVTSLIKKGYIEKHPSQDDKRKTFLHPTEKAQELVESTYSEYYKTMELLQNKMGEEQFHSFISQLQQANQIILEDRTNG